MIRAKKLSKVIRKLVLAEKKKKKRLKVCEKCDINSICV